VQRIRDIGDRAYIIVSGKADVLKGERSVASLGRGEYFGEMALLYQTRRNATVRCVEPMDVLALPKREFSLLSANLPELRRSFETKSQERSRLASDGADAAPAS
jgi:CRP-like cAMP-binding protein